MFLQVLSYLYEINLLAVGIFAAIRYRKVDKATRYIFYWVWLGILTEGIGDISVAWYRTNLPVYSISSLLELFILCGYFNESVPSLRKRGLGLLIGLAGIALGILNICFLQPLTTINSNFLFLECLAIVCLSFYALYRKFAEPDLPIWKETHFCFACMLLFYQCLLLWNWGIYDYVAQVHPGKTIILDIGLLTGNIMTYSCCALLIYRYPKMYQVYV